MYKQHITEIAKHYCIDLAAEIGEENFLKVCDQNSPDEPGDFCDDNMIMGEAFARVMHYWPAASSQRDADIWNAAISCVIYNEFFKRDALCGQNEPAPEYLVMAYYETRNFEFWAFGNTEDDAQHQLEAAWRKHQDQYCRDQLTYSEIEWEDVQLLRCTSGTVLRNRQAM